MSEMCQSCGLEMTTAESDDISKVSFCRECEEKITASSVNEESQLSNASKRIDGLGSVLHGCLLFSNSFLFIEKNELLSSIWQLTFFLYSFYFV